MSKENSTRAYLTAAAGDVLLGGVKHTECHPMETHELAREWLVQTLEANVAAGRKVAAWGYQRVKCRNPIKASEVSNTMRDHMLPR